MPGLASGRLKPALVGELFLGYAKVYKSEQGNLYEQISGTETLQFLKAQQEKQEIFRYHQYDENFVGPSLCWGSVPLGIPTMDWCSASIWVNDYVGLTSIAAQYPSQAAKVWGMLNTKYVLSDRLLDIKGLEFIGEFNTSNPSPASRRLPYVYENQEFLPRAYIVSQAILVFGRTPELEYSIILSPEFRPESEALLSAEELEGLGSLDPEKFGLVILAKQPGDADIELLRQYRSLGGTILPDIFGGKRNIEFEELKTAFEGLDSQSYAPAKVALQSPNKVVIDTRGQKGFLVVSEKYYRFGGWRAEGDGERLNIYRADAAISAVYVDGYKEVVFTYAPASFRIGSLISLASLIVVAGFIIRNRRKSKEKSEP